MDSRIQAALTAGYERLSAWSDLLDHINVFPVADADTGRNLRISLAPLYRNQAPTATVRSRLLTAASGNSGNIAAGFFADFLAADPLKDLPRAIKAGKERAWQVILGPQPGTILTVFDALLAAVDAAPAEIRADAYPNLIARLEAAVHSTSETLPTLKAAGVVDAGALGMFLFMEGFFSRMAGEENGFRPLTEIFRNKLTPAPEGERGDARGFCIDTLVETDTQSEACLAKLASRANSLVVRKDGERLKIHLHTVHHEVVRRQLEEMGRVVRWSATDLRRPPDRPDVSDKPAAVHIVTDSAGSLTRQDAAQLGVTLLDSYILVGDEALPETAVDPAEIYAAMRKGVRVTTAQASVFERHQRFQSIVSRYGAALYLCVGSVYTGNFSATAAWKEKNDPQNRFAVIDTGLASGRLAVVARATVRYARRTDRTEEVLRFAADAVRQSAEYLFIDRLQYLVAGGRLSKTKGYVGDLFDLKPVICPTAGGAVKVGTVRDRKGQLDFALAKLAEDLTPDADTLIMIEYSDNRQWVEDTVLREIKKRYPAAETLLQPLSLTSGVHLGPGTWGVAWGEGGRTEDEDRRQMTDDRWQMADGR
ncbi:MAG: DegV family protein [Desulfobacterales bacterium]